MGFKRNSSWQQSQRATALDRRSSIRLGFLNVNGWSSQSKEDVCKAIEARCIDVFSLVETQRTVEDKDKIKVQGFDVFEPVLVHISPFPWHAHAQVSREASCACAAVERGVLVRMRCSSTVPPPASQSEAAILQKGAFK